MGAGPAATALLAALVAVSSGPATTADGPGESWQAAQPDHAWSFPEDHWAHRPYRTEWWYFTGHLQDVSDPDRRFGYQFTVFRVGLLREAPGLDSDWAAAGLLMGHAAITDITGGEHRFAEVLHRETPFLAGFGSHPDPLLAWSRAAAGTDGQWSLRWNGAAFSFAMVDARQGMALSLDTRPEKPLILQGPNGFSRKSDRSDAASLYYSYTRLATAGSLTLDGRVYEVRGTSWMDKEMSSSQLSPGQVGWDWFSLQLSDGRDLMLYVLRNADGDVDYARGTAVSASGEVRHLGREDWRYEALAVWTSPQTGIAYPGGWRIVLPGGEALRVTPELAGQENAGSRQGGLHYWEGAVRVETMDGAPLGLGYVELTGYGEDNRPPI